MADTKTGTNSRGADRAGRLAAELRANLKKRKAQAAARVTARATANTLQTQGAGSQGRASSAPEMPESDS